jgi:hypothetical protein
MTTHTDITQKHAARIAGLGYLFIIVLGVFAHFFVFQNLIITGDATATANNIIAAESLFRVGIISFIVMLIADVIVAIMLYVLLKPINHGLALLATGFRFLYSSIHGASLVNLVFVLQLLNSDAYLSAFDNTQLHAQMGVFLSAHNYGFLIALIFFGVHCLVLGYLVYKSGYFPKALGALLMLALLLVNYANYETGFMMAVAIPAFIAEISFCLWLLFKGANIHASNDEPDRIRDLNQTCLEK